MKTQQNMIKLTCMGSKCITGLDDYFNAALKNIHVGWSTLINIS